MTREEAIGYLKRADVTVGQEIKTKTAEALELAIQAIKDLDKMNGIALDLASENEDLIETLDAIRAEIEDAIDCKEPAYKAQDNFSGGLQVALHIIDKYAEKAVSKDADIN